MDGHVLVAALFDVLYPQLPADDLGKAIRRKLAARPPLDPASRHRPEAERKLRSGDLTPLELEIALQAAEAVLRC